MAISIKLKQSSLRLLFTYTLGIAAIVYVFHHTDFSALDLKTIFQPKILALLIATRLLGYVLVSLRWKMILQEFSISVPLQQAFRLNMITLSLSYFIPGSVTADLGKGVLLGRQNSGEYKKILLSIFLDRLVGFFAILILFAVGFGWAWQEDASRILLISQSINWKLLGLLGVALAAVFVLLFLKPNRFLKFKKMNLNLQMINRTFWLKTLALSFMAHLTFIFFMLVLAQAMDLKQITLTSSILVFPLASLSLMVPLTPGATGVGQLVYQFFFNLYSGYEASDGILLFTTSQIIELFFVLIGVVFFVLNKKQKSP